MEYQKENLDSFKAELVQLSQQEKKLPQIIHNFRQYKIKLSNKLFIVMFGCFGIGILGLILSSIPALLLLPKILVIIGMISTLGTFMGLLTLEDWEEKSWYYKLVFRNNPLSKEFVKEREKYHTLIADMSFVLEDENVQYNLLEYLHTKAETDNPAIKYSNALSLLEEYLQKKNYLLATEQLVHLYDSLVKEAPKSHYQVLKNKFAPPKPRINFQV